MKRKKVLIGLSGGVDSAVAAHLLQKQGYEVIAGFMKNYSEPDNPQCTTRQDRDMALKVAEHLGIKTFIIFDFRQEYNNHIIDMIYEGYRQGLTPNPDVFCNNLIKFGIFLDKAKELGCDYVATGHYARILKVQDNKGLFRAKDVHKDQSYFLSRLNQQQINDSLFPLGDLTKDQVRKIAHDIGLPNAQRPDSQGLCFIGNIPMKDFLKKKLPEKKGDIITKEGKKVGTHLGAWFYTLGQRHQLFLPFKAYVTSIDVTNNIITVGEKYDEDLMTRQASIKSWVRTGSTKDFTLLHQCLIKIRYRQEPAIVAKLEQHESEKLTFSFDEIRGVTPGQILVAYDDQQQVLGSGIIV